MNEPRARGAAPSPPRKLPMMAHLEPGLGLAIGAIFGLLLALLNLLGQGWSVRLGATLDSTMICSLILRRQVMRPPSIRSDRLLLVVLARAARNWIPALFIVQPNTLLGWHRQAFRFFARVASTSGIKVLKTPFRTPYTNGCCERFLGSVRRQLSFDSQLSVQHS